MKPITGAIGLDAEAIDPDKDLGLKINGKKILAGVIIM